jgi:hypothetical protein
MEDLAQLILRTYGLVGLIILSPFIALVVLWRANVALQKSITALQEARIEDTKGISDRLITIVAEQSSLNKETNMALERVGDMLAVVSNTHSFNR